MAKESKKMRQAVETAQLRRNIVELYFQGMTSAEIGKKLGRTAANIRKHLMILRRQWAKESVDRIGQQRALETRRLEFMMAEALKAWQESKNPEVTESQEDANETTGLKSSKRKVVVKHKHGNPQYLSEARQISERKAKLLGLDMPTKIAHTTPDGEHPYQMTLQNLSDEELAKLMTVEGQVIKHSEAEGHVTFDGPSEAAADSDSGDAGT